MARPIWTGSVAFGLVNVPVAVYAATEDKTVHFNQFQAGASDRIRYKRVNERTGREVKREDIVRGHEVSKGDSPRRARAPCAGTCCSTARWRHRQMASGAAQRTPARAADCHRARPLSPAFPGTDRLLPRAEPASPRVGSAASRLGDCPAIPGHPCCGPERSVPRGLPGPLKMVAGHRRHDERTAA